MSVETILPKIYEFILVPVVWLLFSVALVVFLWGVVEFIWKSGSDTDRLKGKKHMMWGIIGLFIMTSVFGIISLVINTLPGDVDDPTSRVVPG